MATVMLKKRIDISQLCSMHHIIKTDQDKLDMSHDYIPSSVSVVGILYVCRTDSLVKTF